MARFTITLPESIASILATDEELRKIPRSTLIAEYVRQHYADAEKPLVDVDAEIKILKTRHAEELQQLKDQNEQLAHGRVDDEQRFGEEIEGLKTINKTLKSDLKALESSKDVVATGMQHEIELMQQKVSSLEDTLHLERDHLSELRRDKEDCKKQLELVTLRLPAPKERRSWNPFRRKQKEPQQTQ